MLTFANYFVFLIGDFLGWKNQENYGLIKLKSD